MSQHERGGVCHWKRAVGSLVAVGLASACGTAPVERGVAGGSGEKKPPSAQRTRDYLTALDTRLDLLIPLENLLPATNISGEKDGVRYYKFTVPASMQDLRFELSGGTGDADLYVKYGALPDLSRQDELTCAPFLVGNLESCAYTTTPGGTWYVAIDGYTAYSGVALRASFTLPLGTKLTDLADARGGMKYYRVDARSFKALSVQLGAASGSTGDADLYVRFGSLPGLDAGAHDSGSLNAGSNEFRGFDLTRKEPAPAYILVHAYGGYSHVNLVANAY